MKMTSRSVSVCKFVITCLTVLLVVCQRVKVFISDFRMKILGHMKI